MYPVYGVYISYLVPLYNPARCVMISLNAISIKAIAAKTSVSKVFHLIRLHSKFLNFHSECNSHLSNYGHRIPYLYVIIVFNSN